MVRSPGSDSDAASRTVNEPSREVKGAATMPKITYIGHSAFALEDDGKQVLVDPFISGCPTAKHKSDDFNPQTILITHAHNDHVGDSVEIAKRSGATIITVVELADHLGEQGAITIGANHGGTVQFDGGTVKFVPAWHSSTFTTPDGVVAPGVPAGLIVRFGGKTIYFAGDTALFSDMKLIGEEGIDVAVLPIGDHFTMGPDDALRAVKFVEPKTVIPCHCNTFPLLEQDTGAFKQKVESETSAKCVVIEPGDSAEI
jgi:L-ascorbate metabolism protein UlaG (beta-lactamase superfamily)